MAQAIEDYARFRRQVHQMSPTDRIIHEMTATLGAYDAQLIDRRDAITLLRRDLERLCFERCDVKERRTVQLREIWAKLRASL